MLGGLESINPKISGSRDRDFKRVKALDEREEGWKSARVDRSSPLLLDEDFVVDDTKVVEQE